MATKDTGGGQSKAQKTSEEVEEVQAEESTDVADRQAKLTDDVDAILDEIDEILEVNSEEFVRSYVQKGGE
ncbi:MAG: prokaryotic ubiquitin-like protein Pup [Frankiaceae bacterium]|jgi:ubiquitin-like protein Pup|nr:prokaryotic ubiquitin-like protein Pup [Frankiaceae bacterium]MDX6224386.1 prokaryotic ubiquitin-like protein Pup [Frankiales bacterium]MDX6274782.1 prokaryotic ubiquitin-like protein Pup [Frankiales bacterium]